MGDGEKLLTHLNSALKVLLGLDIFPRVPKKKLNFVDQCNQKYVINRNKKKLMTESVTQSALCAIQCTFHQVANREYLKYSTVLLANWVKTELVGLSVSR